MIRKSRLVLFVLALVSAIASAVYYRGKYIETDNELVELQEEVDESSSQGLPPELWEQIRKGESLRFKTDGEEKVYVSLPPKG